MKIKMLRLIVMAVLLSTILPAGAVLKESSFEQTLTVLKAELERSYHKQKTIMALYEQRTKDEHEQLIVTMRRCNQISLILYSQKEDFTFDMAYACQQATDMYNNTSLAKFPYEKIRKRMRVEVDRYDKLIYSLESLPPATNNSFQAETNIAVDDTAAVRRLQLRIDSIAKAMGEEPFILTDLEQQARNQCVIYAKALRNNMVRLMNKIEADTRHYEEVTQRLADLNSYAQTKYEALRRNIFNNRGDDYLTLLMKLPSVVLQVTSEIDDKYVPLADSRSVAEDGTVYEYNSHSQWRGMIIPITSVFVLFYVIVSALLSYAIITWLVPRRIRSRDEFHHKQPVLLIACGFIVFTLSIGVAQHFLTNNFLIMAVKLLLEFSWLVVFILLSLLFRLNGEQISEGVKQYVPFLVMAFVVIVFRIIFIPNNLVNLIFPPILLVFTIWQAVVLRRRKVILPASDMLYSIISFVAMLMACITSFIGYTMMAVEIMIWWTFQLACIQTITFFFDICNKYETDTLIKKIQRAYKEKNNGKLPTDKIQSTIDKLRSQIAEASDDDKPELEQKLADAERRLSNALYAMRDTIKKKMVKGEYIQHTYIFDFITKALIPVMAVVSVLVSLYMAASMFDMTDLFMKYLGVDFVSTSFLHLSILKLCIVISLFFVFKYVNYTGHAFYKELKNRRNEIYLAEERRKLRERGNNGDDIVLPSTNLTLANNIITILVWGSYFITVLYMLNVPKSGITIITTGLATGMGFAMKDLLENFFYGLSLMTGRIRIGDYIECDGIAGKVESITYQSTQIVTRDGCVIAFLNSQLFSKNFKNLTRNHKYEMVKIPIGVAYGVNVQKVREVLIDGINRLIEQKTADKPNLIKKGTQVSVSFSEFGDSSVNLVVVVWVLVEDKVAFVSAANEVIYNVLNDNNIEIPFPQHDLHIRDSVSLPITSDKQHNEA